MWSMRMNVENTPFLRGRPSTVPHLFSMLRMRCLHQLRKRKCVTSCSFLSCSLDRRRSCLVFLVLGSSSIALLAFERGTLRPRPFRSSSYFLPSHVSTMDPMTPEEQILRGSSHLQANENNKYLLQSLITKKASVKRHGNGISENIQMFFHSLKHKTLSRPRCATDSESLAHQQNCPKTRFNTC